MGSGSLHLHLLGFSGAIKRFYLLQGRISWILGIIMNLMGVMDDLKYLKWI